jgi:hypothetical protein
MGGGGFKRIGFAILLLVLSSAPALAGGAEAFAALGGSVAGVTVESSLRLAAHFRKVQSFYCYPKNYWWFYRPYTTAPMNNARCMPYFHYLDEAAVPFRGGRPSREIK